VKCYQEVGGSLQAYCARTIGPDTQRLGSPRDCVAPFEELLIG
jgi:hypothetical protein